MTDYFVVCHDQELTGRVLADPVMKRLERLKVLFVGGRPYDGRYGDKVIVCRDLRHNIEHMPKLVAYTGWHAIVKNGLSTAENICVLEYDIELTSRFDQSVNIGLDNADALGFVNTPINSRLFLEVIPEFKKYINAKYRCDIQTEISKASPTHSQYWPSTSNLAMKRDFLYGFVNWYDSIIPAIADMETMPFVHERAIVIYAKIVKASIGINPNILSHMMQRSHGNTHD